MNITKPSPDLSVVIITCNRIHLLQKCLDSFMGHKFVDSSVEVIIVDNGSVDGTINFVEREYPKVTLIKNSKNRGVGPARNQGIAVARGRYIMLLDDDTEIIGDAFNEMVYFMDGDRTNGVCGCKILSPNGELQYTCRRDTTILAILFRRTLLGKLFPKSKALRDYLMLNYDHSALREVDWVSGACLMMRREIIDQLGPLKGYFHGPEDQEICYRAKKHGWKVMYYPDAKIVHHYARTSAKGINRFTIIQIKEMADFQLIKLRDRLKNNKGS